jgi:hypothetical protein
MAIDESIAIDNEIITLSREFFISYQEATRRYYSKRGRLTKQQQHYIDVILAHCSFKEGDMIEYDVFNKDKNSKRRVVAPIQDISGNYVKVADEWERIDKMNLMPRNPEQIYQFMKALYPDEVANT